MDEREVLKRYFGYDAFRPGQGEVVRALLEGRDALCVMPTGAGKSLCYQVPALLLKGVTLVVSPLISLMKDQVAALNQVGVRAAYLNSSLTPRQFALALENARQGLYRVIYVAPERLETPAFQDLCREIAVPLVAVDEAHCVSQWGQDFRPSYLRIRDFVESLPARPVLGAFTATATPEVRDDIRDLLGLQDPFCVATGFDRPNLRFAVENVPQREKTNALLRLLREQKGRSGIVYCLARRTVEEICEALRARGIAATRYHAGLSDAERRQNQDDFLYDRAEVMVATNAFGMGIDKSNVAFVIHYNMPKNLESYYQEAGRAGRDGSNAVCTLLYSGQDVRLNAFLIEKEEENPLLTEEQARAVREGMREGLRRMARYCTTGTAPTATRRTKGPWTPARMRAPRSGAYRSWGSATAEPSCRRFCAGAALRACRPWGCSTARALARCAAAPCRRCARCWTRSWTGKRWRAAAANTPCCASAPARRRSSTARPCACACGTRRRRKRRRAGGAMPSGRRAAKPWTRRCWPS